MSGPFKLRSGNRPLKFKNMGSSPVKHFSEKHSDKMNRHEHTHPNPVDDKGRAYSEKAGKEYSAHNIIKDELAVTTINPTRSKKKKKKKNEKKTTSSSRGVMSEA